MLVSQDSASGRRCCGLRDMAEDNALSCPRATICIISLSKLRVSTLAISTPLLSSGAPTAESCAISTTRLSIWNAKCAQSGTYDREQRFILCSCDGRLRVYDTWLCTTETFWPSKGRVASCRKGTERGLKGLSRRTRAVGQVERNITARGSQGAEHKGTKAQCRWSVGRHSLLANAARIASGMGSQWSRTGTRQLPLSLPGDQPHHECDAQLGVQARLTSLIVPV